MPYFLRSRCLFAASDFLIPCLQKCKLASVMNARENSRLVHELGPDSLHVLVGFDHLGIVVGRSCKEDIVLCGEFTRDGDLIKCDLVAVFISFVLSLKCST